MCGCDVTWVPSHNNATQVKQLKSFDKNVARGLEGVARRLSRQNLQESGHENATEFCLQKIPAAQKGDTLCELDGAAIADHCAVVAEAKHVLSSSAVNQLFTKLEAIR